MTNINFPRHFLSICLFCVFVWQTVFSVNKYLEGDTSTTLHLSNVKVEEFPDLSFCPIFSFLDVDAITSEAIIADNTTFEKEYNEHLPAESSIVEYYHYDSGRIE